MDDPNSFRRGNSFMIDPKAPNTTRKLTLADLKAGGDSSHKRVMSTLVEFDPLPDGTAIAPALVYFLPPPGSYTMEIIKTSLGEIEESNREEEPSTAQKIESTQDKIMMPASFVAGVMCDETGVLMFKDATDLLACMDLDTLMKVFHSIFKANNQVGEASGGETSSAVSAEDNTALPTSLESGTSSDGSEKTSPKVN